MKSSPDSVKKYLKNLDTHQRADGYLCLDKTQQILYSDGWVGTTNLANFDPETNLAQAIPVLEGLLPINSDEPTIITHAHVDRHSLIRR